MERRDCFCRKSSRFLYGELILSLLSLFVTDYRRLLQMMLGGGHHGERLSKPYKAQVTEPEILAILKPMIKQWALERNDGEPFGDWVIRAGIIKETTHGTNFWSGTDAA